MEERFLFRGVAGQRGDIIRGHSQMAVFIESHFADAALAFIDQTTVAAGVTLERSAGQVLNQFGRSLQSLRHQGHWLAEVDLVLIGITKQFTRFNFGSGYVQLCELYSFDY